MESSTLIATTAAAAPQTNPLWFLLLLVILIFINAFFAASELALISLNKPMLKYAKVKKPKKIQLILKMLSMPTSFLATIQIGVTLSGFLASAVAADTFAEYLVYYLSFLPISPDILRAVSIIVITILLSLATLIFGELVPKRLALQNPQKIALLVAKPLWIFCVLFKPVAIFLSKTTDLIAKLLGSKENKMEEGVSEEEIKIMVEETRAKGKLAELQKDMIDNVFEFDDRIVTEIMTHRTELVAVSEQDPLDRIIDVAVKSGFSRLPVYCGNLDNIMGVLYVKDLLSFLQNDIPEKFNIHNYIHEALYVPKTLSCIKLFSMFQKKQVHLAIVVDEYGGTFGVVTMENLLETIVGNIQDEYDHEESPIEPLEAGSYSIDGDAPIEQVEALFQTKFEEAQSETIGGFIVQKLGFVPFNKKDCSITISGIEFIPLEVSKKCILRLKAQKSIH